MRRKEKLCRRAGLLGPFVHTQRLIGMCACAHTHTHTYTHTYNYSFRLRDGRGGPSRTIHTDDVLVKPWTKFWDSDYLPNTCNLPCGA